MDLRAIAKLISSKAIDSADLDDVLKQYGLTLSFDEKIQLVHMLSSNFFVIYDVLLDKFILVKRAADGQEAQAI